MIRIGRFWRFATTVALAMFPMAVIGLQTPGLIPIPQGDTFTVHSSKGSATVKNFFVDSVHPITGSAVYLADNDDYAIVFSREDGEFLVQIFAHTREQAQTIRPHAEELLIKKLGVDQATACDKLNVAMEVPPSYNNRLSGINYGLSFCPDGLPIQQNSVTAQRRAKTSKPKIGISSRGPDVYVEQGRCPFECCKYREWWAAAPTPVYASPNSKAPQIRMLKKGEHVTAVTGFVRTRGGEFTVTRNNGRYHAGDTIWVYSYRGEGFFTVWFKGKMYGEELGFSPYGGSGGSRCQEDSSYCWGTLKTEHSSEWWIKLRLSDGRIGWTNRGEDYSNIDACG
jgi:hypothetical protein